ncbi:hypothetical protein IE53DRAFT_78685 [Violaceomyces palustris]|uniref:Uncharacterized protein n=1 Tax=Violaceomyces palustris TaxID=1673888 RepID=A0ACD0NYJ0_9BASI|nr:hypothetical protein IE53DRAFT_78685 [Violaceomyces palustris]
MTTGDDDTTQTVIQLPTNLSQLVDDCFDEEQYDQAVNLLDQLRSRSILPTRTHLAQLFSLSLCSLPERNTLPTFSSSFRSSATSQARLPKTPHSSTRPSPNSILASTLLLRRLSQVVEENVRRGGCDDGGGDGDHDHDPTLIQVSSYISSCLPSHSSVSRPPSLEPSSGKPRSLSAGLHPHSGSDDDHLEENPIQTWTESRFLSSRDVWDLLTCTGQASEHLPSPERILVDEFWMTAKEKVKATNEIKRLRLRTTLPWNRDSRGKRGKRPKLSGSTAKRARGATKVRFEHRKVSSETFPEECSAVSSASVSGEEEEEEKGYPSSPKKRVASNNRGRDDVEEDEDDDLIHGQVELSEGSWRTLDVLVGMWHADMRSRSMSSSSKQGNDSRLEDCSLANQFPKQAQGQPKIFSFGRAKVGRGQSGIKGMGSTEVGKPLDIVFSFHRSLPVTWWGWDEAKDGLDTLDDKVGGSGRPWRCGMVGFDEQDWGNASRAKTAARLLSLVSSPPSSSYLMQIGSRLGLNALLFLSHLDSSSS